MVERKADSEILPDDVVESWLSHLSYGNQYHRHISVGLEFKDRAAVYFLKRAQEIDSKKASWFFANFIENGDGRKS